MSGREQLVGATGRVLQASDDEAWAEVQGERWRVQSDRPLAAGERVRVLQVEGLTLHVRIDHDINGGLAS